MKRTISAEVGKGSVNHNSRKFKAANVDPERTHLNIEYCKPWNGTTKSRHALTDGSKITMRRSVPANRKSPSMN